MDIPVLVLFGASMFVVGCLAHWRGRRPSPWVALAAFIGPFAIPVLFLTPRRKLLSHSAATLPPEYS